MIHKTWRLTIGNLFIEKQAPSSLKLGTAWHGRSKEEWMKNFCQLSLNKYADAFDGAGGGGWTKIAEIWFFLDTDYQNCPSMDKKHQKVLPWQNLSLKSIPLRVAYLQIYAKTSPPVDYAAIPPLFQLSN